MGSGQETGDFWSSLENAVSGGRNSDVGTQMKQGGPPGEKA